jgi:hypothetical protein
MEATNPFLPFSVDSYARWSEISLHHPPTPERPSKRDIDGQISQRSSNSLSQGCKSVMSVTILLIRIMALWFTQKNCPRSNTYCIWRVVGRHTGPDRGGYTRRDTINTLLPSRVPTMSLSCVWPVGSNSLDFPKPARPRPGTLPAGYKPIGVIQRLSPSNVATRLLRPMAPPLRGGVA